MNDSELNQLLQACGSCQTPSGFKSDVWNRIAVEPDSASSLSAWKRLLADVCSRLSQPATALATCAAFVIAGTLIGIRARPQALPDEVQYIQSVSPFIHQSAR